MATTCQPKDTTSKALTHKKHNPPNPKNRDTNEPSARKGGDVILKISLALNSSGPNTTNEAEEYMKHFYQLYQSISKDAHIKASRRMHTSKHLEGCTYQNTPKDANKASRMMHRSKHLEGCTFQSTSKDENKASRRLHPEGQNEGYAQKSNPKGAIIGLERILYTLKRLAKVAFRQQNKSYNESRPDQLKYSATLHPG